MMKEIKTKEEALIKDKIFIYLGNTIDAINEDPVIPESVSCIQNLLNIAYTNENLNKTDIEDILTGLELINEKYKYIKEKCEKMMDTVGPYPDDETREKFGYQFEDIYNICF